MNKKCCQLSNKMGSMSDAMMKKIKAMKFISVILCIKKELSFQFHIPTCTI